MGEIHGKADKVIAWTGLEDQGISPEDRKSSPFSIEKVLFPAVDLISSGSLECFSIGDSRQEWKQVDIIVKNPGCEALSRVCTRRYWTRF